MKNFWFISLIFFISFSGSSSFAQDLNSCLWSRDAETELRMAALSNQQPEIDSNCLEKKNFFESLINFQKIRTLPVDQASILSLAAIEKIDGYKNVWVLTAYKDQAIDANSSLTWGQIAKQYKIQMDKYFDALSEKNSAQVNTPETFELYAPSLNLQVSTAQTNWNIYGRKISFEGMANHILAGGH